MVTELWARLEDPQGRVVGPDPAWKPQRQFLWEVIHDTRGLLRGEAFAEDLEVIRTIDAAAGRGGPRYAHDPAHVRAIYERILERVRSLGESRPAFRLVAPEGSDAWAAVQFFKDAGNEFAVVGGWSAPLVRNLSVPGEEQFLPETDTVTVGFHRFRVRSVPFADYFRADFESLFALLRSAESRRLRIRFLQR